jgi:sigma-B regulation protein RsbU (phosphoserine phosphatase)
MFATVFIGGFDVQNGKLAYINCGNEAPLLLRDGCVITALKTTSPVVGVFPGIYFQAREIALERGDLLLAYTDGIPDTRNMDGDSFSNKRLLSMVNDVTMDASQMLEHIEKQLHCFMGEAHQYDDITMMAVKRNC